MNTGARTGRRAFTLLELLVVIAIIGLLMALALAGVQRVRAAAARTHCSNNLRQIGLALASYESTRRSLPPGMSLAESGSEPHPYLSWLARILPYIEQDGLWRQAEAAYAAGIADFRLSPPHPFATPVKLYGCPADGRTLEPGLARDLFPAAFTAYLGVSGTRTLSRNGVLYVNSRTQMRDILDGTSNTLLVGERPPSGDLWEGWWYAGHGCDGGGLADFVLGTRDGGAGCLWSLEGCPRIPAGFVRGRIENNCDALHFWSLHDGGANFLFCDGSVRFLSYSVNPLMPALATRASGEIIDGP